MLYAHGPDLCHESDLKHAMANCFEALMGELTGDFSIVFPNQTKCSTSHWTEVVSWTTCMFMLADVMCLLTRLSPFVLVMTKEGYLPLYGVVGNRLPLHTRD